jgi:hypothetical protein
MIASIFLEPGGTPLNKNVFLRNQHTLHFFFVHFIDLGIATHFSLISCF